MIHQHDESESQALLRELSGLSPLKQNKLKQDKDSDFNFSKMCESGPCELGSFRNLAFSCWLGFQVRDSRSLGRG
jgi:hypothetical protein